MLYASQNNYKKEDRKWGEGKKKVASAIERERTQGIEIEKRGSETDKLAPCKSRARLCPQPLLITSPCEMCREQTVIESRQKKKKDTLERYSVA